MSWKVFAHPGGLQLHASTLCIEDRISVMGSSSTDARLFVRCPLKLSIQACDVRTHTHMHAHTYTHTHRRKTTV